MIGVYLGKDDDDLKQWKEKTADYSAFAREAIREKLMRERGQINDSVSLRQAVKLLEHQSQLLGQMLVMLQQGVMLTGNTQQQGGEHIKQDLKEPEDFVKMCQDLGW